MSPRFVCPYCRRKTSYPEDVLTRYCPCCGWESMPKGCVHRPRYAPARRDAEVQDLRVARLFGQACLTFQVGVLAVGVALGLFNALVIGTLCLVVGGQLGALYAFHQARHVVDRSHSIARAALDTAAKAEAMLVAERSFAARARLGLDEYRPLGTPDPASPEGPT